MSKSMNRIPLRVGAAVLALALALAGCATAPLPPADLAHSGWARQSTPGVGAPAAWKHHPLPGKQPTRFEAVRLDGREAIAVRSEAAASMLRSQVRVEPADLGALRFSWKVASLPAEADLGSRDHDDAPVRVVLAFEGDRQRFAPRDAMLNELVRAVTGEEMPYATLMYVWCNTREPGTVLSSPRTSRIRKIVVESGGQRLDHWLEYERDVRADYERAFGEPPGALVGIGIMTDTDNTRGQTTAWYGPLRLAPSLQR